MIYYRLGEVFLFRGLRQCKEYSLSLLADSLQVLGLAIFDLCHHIKILEVYLVVHQEAEFLHLADDDRHLQRFYSFDD